MCETLLNNRAWCLMVSDSESGLRGGVVESRWCGCVLEHGIITSPPPIMLNILESVASS